MVGKCVAIDLGVGNDIYCSNAKALGLPRCDAAWSSSFAVEMANVEDICNARPDCIGVYDFLADGAGLRLCNANIQAGSDHYGNHTVWTKPKGPQCKANFWRGGPRACALPAGATALTHGAAVFVPWNLPSAGHLRTDREPPDPG